MDCVFLVLPGRKVTTYNLDPRPRLNSLGDVTLDRAPTTTGDEAEYQGKQSNDVVVYSAKYLSILIYGGKIP